MILRSDRQQRNFNYLELIKKHNSFYEKFGNTSRFNKKDLYAFTEQLIGNESLDIIADALIPDAFMENDRELEILLETDNGEYALSKESKILPPPSREEAAMVFTLLENGDLDLYINQSTKEKIRENAKRFFDNAGEKPVNLYDYIETKGASACADNLSDIKPAFELIRNAINKDSYIGFNYYYNDEWNEFTVKPVSFVFSQLDRRLRIKAYVEQGYWMTFYLSYIQDLKTLSDIPFEFKGDRVDEDKTLVFTFKNEHNLAERVAACFSNYKKQIKFIKKENLIEYKVFYKDNMTENARILNRLRSLGMRITILSDEKELVKADAAKALENYT